MKSIIVSAVMFVVAGCAQDLGSQDPAASSATGAATVDPCGNSPIDAVPWKAGMTGLWPDAVLHLDTIVTIGTTRGTFFAWGVGDGQKLLWVFEVQSTDRLAWEANGINEQQHHEAINSLSSHGGAGSVVGGNPPPRIGGVPQFPPAYQQRILRTAAEITDGTNAALAFKL